MSVFISDGVWLSAKFSSLNFHKTLSLYGKYQEIWWFFCCQICVIDMGSEVWPSPGIRSSKWKGLKHIVNGCLSRGLMWQTISWKRFAIWMSEKAQNNQTHKIWTFKESVSIYRFCGLCALIWLSNYKKFSGYAQGRVQ